MWLDDMLGITGRLDGDDELRRRADQAQPGEVWTSRIADVDKRRQRCVSWVVGEVRQNAGVKRVGGQELLDPATLSRAGGALRARCQGLLRRGEQGAPPQPPFATGAELEQVPMGQKVVVEHVDPRHRGVRHIEAGTCDFVQALPSGERGRRVGNVWVPLDQVLGLVLVETDKYEQFERGAQNSASQPLPGGVPVQGVTRAGKSGPTAAGLTSESGMTSTGGRS